MRRKMLVAVAAIMLAGQLGSPLSAAQPSAEQLEIIAGYLESNDVRGLRAYLMRYPELAEGQTVLAALLRRFLVESASTYFRFEPNLSDTVDNLQDAPTGGGPSGIPEPPEPSY